jgi:hypothetical protein
VVLAQPPQDLITLTDLSEVVYPPLNESFVWPPGLEAGERPSKRREWVKRSARLHPALVAEVVADLNLLGDHAIAVVEHEPVDVLWPTANEETAGYLVPRIDPAFFVNERDGRQTLRTLNLALPDHAEESERRADAFDRLELVRLVGLLLGTLHNHGLVTAGISWHTFVFKLEPRPEVVLHRPGRVRRVGGEFLDQPYAARPTGSSPSPYDGDRGDFALLAFRLLVALDLDAPLDLHVLEQVPGTSPSQTEVLRRLWERAAGPTGSRPQLPEWLEAFGVQDPTVTEGDR